MKEQKKINTGTLKQKMWRFVEISAMIAAMIIVDAYLFFFLSFLFNMSLHPEDFFKELQDLKSFKSFHWLHSFVFDGRKEDYEQGAIFYSLTAMFSLIADLYLLYMYPIAFRSWRNHHIKKQKNVNQK